MKYIKGFEQKNKLNFIDMSNRFKRRRWYENKFKVEQQRIEYKDDRLFYSYDLYHFKDDNDKEVELNLSWSDIYFPSYIYKNRVYTAIISTCQYTMMEEVNNKFLYEVCDEVDSFGIKNPPFIFEKHQMIINDVKIPQYNGRTKYEEMDKRMDDWLAKQQVNPNYEIYEYWTTKVNWGPVRYAIPLEIVLDVKYLHLDTINNWIKRFTEMGEIDYKSPEPVPQENLLYSKDWTKEYETGIANSLI